MVPGVVLFVCCGRGQHAVNKGYRGALVYVEEGEEGENKAMPPGSHARGKLDRFIYTEGMGMCDDGREKCGVV